MTTTPSSLTPRFASRWQGELAQAIRTTQALAAALDLPLAALGPTADVAFPLRVPRGFVARMRRGDPRDPLLLQVLPTVAELRERPGYGPDPLQELGQMRHPGLLQKYRGRALLLASGACAVNCRYCFRREFPYGEATVSASEIEAAAQTIEADPDLHEIILSGGDPLSLADARLGLLFERLGRIPQLRRIRIHTRLPVVLPERIDASLLAVLARVRQPLVIVLHINHAQEIDAHVAAVARELRPHCALLLNQSVLLRGVNDNVDALAALSERLFEIGVTPYYLHQLDPVRGAGHFRVSDRRARALVGQLAARLSGYLVPKLVRERPGLPAKELLLPVYGDPLSVRALPDTDTSPAPDWACDPVPNPTRTSPERYG